MLIGILCLQGAFIEHQKMLEKLAIQSVEIREKKDLSKPIDGLIIPGGESTSMSKLLHELDLFSPIKKMIMDGLPTFGTCAGMILLAKKIIDSPEAHLQTMDIEVRRNAYGRQLGSFKTNALFNDGLIPQIFIRAPSIESLDKKMDILSIVEGNVVAARQNNQLVTAFHPELSDDVTVHQYFINMITNKDLK